MNKLAVLIVLSVVAYGIFSFAGIVSIAPIDALLSFVSHILVG